VNHRKKRARLASRREKERSKRKSDYAQPLGKERPARRCLKRKLLKNCVEEGKVAV